jgi:hypothetical protein
MLNITLPPKPEKKEFKADGKQPYNLISLLIPKIRYKSEMKQYEERLAMVEKQWPGLKECKYDVEWYSRKRFHDFLSKIYVDLFYLRMDGEKIVKLNKEIRECEEEKYGPVMISVVSIEPPKPIDYYKEYIQHGNFKIFVDLYNTREDAEKEARYLNDNNLKYGFNGDGFFVMDNLVEYIKRTDGFVYHSDNLLFPYRENMVERRYYVVVGCQWDLYKAMIIPDKKKEIDDLKKKLQELKINKIMADNGFDEYGRMLKQ